MLWLFYGQCLINSEHQQVIGLTDRFFFYSNEGDPREPVHIHVLKAGSEAKFWVGNDIVLARSNGFDAKSLRLIAELVEENKQVIEESWHEHFG